MSLKVNARSGHNIFPEIQVSTLELDVIGKTISNERVKNDGIYADVVSF